MIPNGKPFIHKRIKRLRTTAAVKPGVSALKHTLNKLEKFGTQNQLSEPTCFKG
jgi:hypothetical protein